MDTTNRLAEQLDRSEIIDLVRRERFCRDQHRWAEMRDCFHAEATIRTSWFHGGQAEEYVRASQERHPPGGTSKHWVFPGYILLNGDRATVESPATIFDRIPMNGTEVDLHVYCRFHSRVERREGVWRLLSFDVLWERDALHCVDPTEPLPVDWQVLATYRPSYRFLTCFQESRGTTVDPNLPGDDRPETLQAFHQAAEGWLNASKE